MARVDFCRPRRGVDGVPVAGEYEIKNALDMKILDSRRWWIIHRALCDGLCRRRCTNEARRSGTSWHRGRQDQSAPVASIERWNGNAPAHHCAVGVGRLAGRLEKLEALLKIEVVRVCENPTYSKNSIKALIMIALSAPRRSELGAAASQKNGISVSVQEGLSLGRCGTYGVHRAVRKH
jgi:hypothetical protein